MWAFPNPYTYTTTLSKRCFSWSPRGKSVSKLLGTYTPRSQNANWSPSVSGPFFQTVNWWHTSWWLNQPIWKICEPSNWIMKPQGSGWKYKMFELPPPRWYIKPKKLLRDSSSHHRGSGKNSTLEGFKWLISKDSQFPWKTAPDTLPGPSTGNEGHLPTIHFSGANLVTCLA